MNDQEIEILYRVGYGIARQLGTSLVDYDDLVQEGVLAGIDVDVSGAETPMAYRRKAMRNRMLSILMGKSRPTTSEDYEGRVFEPHRAGSTVEFDETEHDQPDLMFEAAEALVAEVARDREVRSAVEALAERDRGQVQLRFFEGLGRKETAEKIGMSVANLDSRWQNVIKPTLRRDLASYA